MSARRSTLRGTDDLDEQQLTGLPRMHRGTGITRAENVSPAQHRCGRGELSVQRDTGQVGATALTHPRGEVADLSGRPPASPRGPIAGFWCGGIRLWVNPLLA